MAAQSWIRGKLLGAGTFGSVNLAINRENGEVFAVKSVQVTERDSRSEVAVRAIENEIDILEKLDSKYVVRCLGSDWTEESGQLMRNVFLEYMPDGCLTDFVKQFANCGALNEHLLRKYTRSIVEGIDYLHSNGIVHCDIKGKNILIGNGSVKLTDFGSSKRVGGAMESDVMNCSATVNGTPLWMAPEVVNQVEQGPASDIWSLGCTVVEMATGRAPWSNFANHYAALYHIGCTDELPEVPASLSAEAHDFLSHCFQREPSKRWTSTQLLQHPFLTTRFVAAAPAVSKAALSPTTVLRLPVDSDSDAYESYVYAVPTLAAPAPSLFKRGLVCAKPKSQEQVEEDWWSTSASPDSGPWIVVRSPRSSSPANFFVASEIEILPVSIETPLVSQKVGDREPNFISSDVLVEQSPSGFVFMAASCSCSSMCFETSSLESVVDICDAGESSPVCNFAISEMGVGGETSVADDFVGLSVWVSGDNRCSAKDEETPNYGLSLAFGAVIDTACDSYFELGSIYQYSNSQILIYWHYRLDSKGSRTSRELTCWHLHYVNQCVLQTPCSMPVKLHRQHLSPFGSCMMHSLRIRSEKMQVNEFIEFE
uniref:Protein kinase domain-containing protein n=1 Tax=Physcomitrium patens TaxID=3218 RepID=A0A2K1IPE1_PHYPA|nr:hypothetical protein PHYPA_027454 [Physcomitrium patens]